MCSTSTDGPKPPLVTVSFGVRYFRSLETLFSGAMGGLLAEVFAE